jgi:4-amino-4-deoxy-L-arabinose transferase-like glycosyltransferase
MVTVTLYFLAVKKLYDLKTATVSSVIFSFSVPVMVYGAAISTDMLGYLAIAAAVFYLSTSPNPNEIKLSRLVMLSILLYFAVMGREVSVLLSATSLFTGCWMESG